MNDYAFLILGVTCAAVGGELFVRGTVGIAHWLRVSPGIIGATVAAFATSSPELSVGIMSALEHRPQISLGDALGSNVVNIGLILALTVLIGAIRCTRDSIKRDFSVALLAPIIVGVLCFDGELTRFDGAILLGCFVVWIVSVTLEAHRQRNAADRVLGESRHGLALLVCGIGLALLIAAGRLIVDAATGIAADFGIGEFVIGAVVVAIGTSAPELATAVIAKLRGHDEVGIGTLLGSNIFNGLFIVAIPALISPYTLSVSRVEPALLFGVIATVFMFPSRSGMIERRRGVLLLVIYLVFVAVSLQELAH